MANEQGAGASTAALKVDPKLCVTCKQPFSMAATAAAAAFSTAPMREPRVLWCGHAMCLPCATAEATKVSAATPAGTVPLLLRCGGCGESTPFGRGDVGSVLPLDRTRVADADAGEGKSEAKAQAQEKCVCEKNVATIWCPKCGHDTLFCADCYADNHKMAPKLLALHRQIALSDRDTENAECKAHANKLTLYCTPCGVAVCPQCKEAGEKHAGHDTQAVAKVAADARAVLSARAEGTGGALAEQLRRLARAARDGIEQTEASTKQALVLIEEKIALAQALLGERKKQLEEEVVKQRKQRMQALDALGADAALALGAALMSTLDTRAALAKTNDLAVLHLRKALDEQYAGVVDVRRTRAQAHAPITAAIPLRFGPSALQDVLQSFGSVGGPNAPLLTDVKVSARNIVLTWAVPGSGAGADADAKDVKAQGAGSALKEVVVEVAALGAGVSAGEDGKAAPVDASAAAAPNFAVVYRGLGNTFDLKAEPLNRYIIRLRAADEASGFGPYGPLRHVTTPKAGGFVDSKILSAEQNRKLSEFYGREDEWKLLYRGSRDGFAAATFHKRCDNKGETMSVVQSANGNVFGGYTPLPWTSNGGYRFDSSRRAFLFSLKNTTPAGAFKCLNTGAQNNDAHSVYCNPAYGPTFGGGCDLAVAENCNTSQTSYADLGHSYELPKGFAYGTPTTKALLGGSERFKVAEIEVWGK